MIGKLRSKRRHNGHPVNGSEVASQPTNGHAAKPPATDVEVSSDFRWSLEVRHESELVGSMHGSNPLALVSYFREYAVLYGDPEPGYEVLLSHNRSDRKATLSYQNGEQNWRKLLQELDPELDDSAIETRYTGFRTPMADPHGHPLNVDSVFEEVFGQV